MPKFNTNQVLDKVIRYGDKLTGHTKRKLENAADVLSNASSMGIPGIHQTSINAAQRMVKNESKEVARTRTATGIVGTAAIGGGFLGIHKYQQHQDNKILARIDKMYKTK